MLTAVKCNQLTYLLPTSKQKIGHQHNNNQLIFLITFLQWLKVGLVSSEAQLGSDARVFFWRQICHVI